MQTLKFWLTSWFYYKNYLLSEMKNNFIQGESVNPYDTRYVKQL